MNTPSTNHLISSSPRLGLRGLPHLVDAMNFGGLYALIAETPPARFPVLSGSLASALQSGITCTVIVSSDPKSFIQRINSFGNPEETAMLGVGPHRFFTMQDEFAKKMFQFGADSFVQELEHFNIPPDSYLVFDQADELLSLHDISLASEQVDTVRRWCHLHRVTLLLVFSRASEADTSTLNALMDNLTGMARLGSDKDGLELTFDYWQSQEGTVAARNFRLSTGESGLYEASAKIAPTQQGEDRRRPTAEPAPAPVATELHFFYMDADLGGLAKQMNGTWHHVDTLVGMMHATRNRSTATCLLTYQRDTSLRQLAEAIHTLRLSLGRHARIVVHEKDASLRYQNEALLLRLGVNLVVNRDVPPSRLPLLIDALAGQVFARDVDINFEAALASVLPTRLRGYQIPVRFAREVTAMLSQGETLNIPSALIVGKPRPEVAITDILGSNGLSRAGDLITTDSEFCHLFLNACPQSAMLLALDRILGAPADSFFESVRFLVNREEILSVLHAMARDAEMGKLPDYSAMFSAQPVAEKATPAEWPSTTFLTQTPKDVALTPQQFGPATETGPEIAITSTDRPKGSLFQQYNPIRAKTATSALDSEQSDRLPGILPTPKGHTASVTPISRIVTPRAKRSQSAVGSS